MTSENKKETAPSVSAETKIEVATGPMDEPTEKTAARPTANGQGKDAVKQPVSGTAAGTQKATPPLKEFSGYCVYIGPTIRGVIQHGNIFQFPKEEAKKRLNIAIDRYPEVFDLIAPGNQLAAKAAEVKNKKSWLYHVYNRLEKKINAN